jgi:hypothetical protein
MERAARKTVEKLSNSELGILLSRRPQAFAKKTAVLVPAESVTELAPLHAI